ncbi:MAG: beta-ketoacyl-ACP synthase II [Deltaproteobacteria bacterium]|nr:beta-ketoacyl-ACP synthase II [Deltaproteobacteria bacterium]
MSTRRVAITGIGLVTPLATGTRESWSALIEGRPGIGPLTRFDAADFSVQCAGQVDDFEPERFLPRARIRHMDRYAQLACGAAQLALDDASLEAGDLPARSAVFMGVGLGGLETIERNHDALREKGPRFITPYFIPMIIPNMAAGWISLIHAVTGRSLTLATACASGAHALGEAFHLLRSGSADLVIAGGAEAAVTPLGIGGFAAMRALSTRDVDPSRASCPFDAARDGFVLAEGAAVLVLEPEDAALDRGGRPYARLSGYGAASDAHDITQPDPEGAGALAAMRMALEDAGLEPSCVDYVNAHATSTPLGDRVEAAAIRALTGGRPVAVSSTKGATGHLLGAAGALEAALTALAIREETIPPTLNLEDPGPGCDLDHVTGGPRRQPVRAALSNAFGFGGTNATLVLERGEER